MRCPRCSDESPPDARFCGSCGASLEPTCRQCGVPIRGAPRFCRACGEALGAARASGAERTLGEERKQVTVLFADVKGSLELIARRDAEEAREVLDALLARMIEAVHHYEGTVNQVMGDGIMALFGAPMAHEDHAVRACYAALRMQENVGRASEALERRLGIPVQLRVGLNSGEVVVRAIGSDVGVDYSAIGQTTHLAARMEQMTEPGKILITTATLRLAEGAVRVVPMGPVPVKGLAEPAEVFRLVGAVPGGLRFATAVSRGLTPLVGRDAELAALRAALRHGAGPGRIVALVGGPGVGKSRLAWEFAQTRRAEGWRVLTGSGRSHARGVPYAPIVECLRAYLEIAEDAAPGEIREAVSARLRALDPRLEGDLPPLLALLEALPPDAPFRQVEARTRRGRTLEAVKRVLLCAGQQQATLLLLEDAHWFDPDSQAVLDLLVDGLAVAPLRLLVTYRPEYQHGWSGRSSYSQVRVDPLAPQFVEPFLRGLLGPGRDLDPVIELLDARCDGNPFFLEESVRALIEESVLSGERGAHRLARPLAGIQVPPTVQAVLAARIDRLPAPDKEIVQCAGVIGREFSSALLAAVLRHDEAPIVQGLERLAAAELIYEGGLLPERQYSFKHALTHQVAYESLLQSRRRELHAAVLTAMEEMAEERRPGVERLAEHALHGHQWTRAVRYLQQAGARAFARSAYRAAVSWFERALEILPRLPADREAMEAAVDLRLELRYALSPLGEFPRMLECLREAEELARALGDEGRTARIASYLANYFQVMGDLDRALAHGQRALDIALRQGDLAIQVVARSYLSLACQTRGDYARGIDLARENLEALGRARQPEWFGMAILPAIYTGTALVRCLAETGDFAEAIEVGARGMQIAREIDHSYSLMFACLGLGVAQLRRGRAAEATRLLEDSLRLCRAGDSRAMTSLVAGFLAAAHARAGRLDEALAQAGEAEAQATAPGLPGVTLPRGVALAALADAHLEAGRLAEAATAARQARENFARMGARGYEGWVLLTLGLAGARRRPDEPEAERHLGEARARAEALGMAPLEAHCLLGLGELHARLGRRDEARTAVGDGLCRLRRLGIERPVGLGERLRAAGLVLDVN